MSIAFDLFGINDLVKTPCAVVLSISKGVRGYRCPNSIKDILSVTLNLVFTHAAAISDSEVELITLHSMLASTCIGAFIKTRCLATGLLGSYLLPSK